MRYSDNYNLKLPQRGVDRANVDDLDSNFETIDGALADDRQISLLMYDSTSTYNTGDIVGYENPTTHRIRAYRCLEDNVTGPWDATKWAQTTLADEIGTGGGASSLEDLTDTDITSPSNGQTLKYNSTSGKWENASGGAVSDLDDLGDVDITTPSDGDLLTYDAQNDEWVNAPASVPDLGDLGDVTLTTPTEGQILTYDGDEWVNTDAPDVDVTKTATGNPIEISDGAAAPLVKCVTQITGYQQGSGTPSPDNIRPIVAYTEGEIEVSDGDGNTTTHATTYPSAVYRGSEDVVNGTVGAGSDGEEWFAVDISTLNFSPSDAAQHIFRTDSLCGYIKPSDTRDSMPYAIASCYYGMGYTPLSTNDNGRFAVAQASHPTEGRIVIIDHRFSTVADFVAGIAGQTIAYRLYNPTTTSVTPTNLPIKSLNGYSHIESTTGEMEIEYITGKYQPIIEIAEREIKTIDEMLTENIESSMVASQNYTTGELLIACGKIYRATANIASGSSLTVGTNVTQTTIEAEIARSGGGANYSTTEHIVGTWIDGSTIYEQTFSFSIPSNNYTTETTGITNFDKCIGYTGIVMLGSGIFEDINYSRPESSNSTYYTAITADGDIFFKTFEATTGTVYITMRYTKSS